MRYLTVFILFLLFGLNALLAQCPQYDFSHLESGFELDCANTPISIPVVTSGPAPETIIWTGVGNVLGTDSLVTLTSSGSYNLIVTGEDGCFQNIPFVVEGTAINPVNFPTALIPGGCLEPGQDSIYCLDFWNTAFDYQWSDGTPGPCIINPNINETYTVTMTNAAGCSEEFNFNIPVVVGIQVDVQSVDNGPCLVQGVEINIFDDTGGDDFYIISFFNITTGESFTFEEDGFGPFFYNSLTAGQYFVDAFNPLGCASTDTWTFTLTGGSPEILATITQPACSGEFGEIDLLVSGGTPPYTFFWDDLPGPGPEDRIDLLPGVYFITVTDDNDCASEAVFTIGEGSGLEITQAIITDVDCATGALGSIVLDLNIPVNQADFFWSNDWDTEENLNLAAGDYTVTITDIESDCSIEATFTVGAGIEVFVDWTNGGVINCNEPTVVLFANPGGPNYTYEWSGPGGFTDNNQTITVDVPGNYTVIVTDLNDPACTGSDSFFVEEDLAPVEFDYSVSSLFVCPGDPATLVVEVTSSSSEWNILHLTFNGGEPVEFPFDEASFDLNLNQGSYEIFVENGLSGCVSATQTFVIEGGLPTEFNLESSTSNCGLSFEVDLEPFGDDQLFTYEWSNGSGSQDQIDLAPGFYCVTVTNEDGCSSSQCITLVAPSLDANFFVDYPIDTTNCVPVLAILTANIPLQGYTFSWETPSGPLPQISPIQVTESGAYTLVVTETATGCEFPYTDTVDLSNEPFVPQIEVFTPPCNTYTQLSVPLPAFIDPNALSSQWIIPDGTLVDVFSPDYFAVEPGQYIYLGNYADGTCFYTDTIFLATASSPCDGVSGRLWADEGNCQLDGTEIPVPQWLVNIETAAGTFVTMQLTDNLGQFQATLAPGNYLASANPYNNDLYYECPTPQAFTVDGNGNGYVDVFMPYLEECPTMYVNVSAPVLRRCFENDVYLFYCNDGPVTATGASLLVELDPFLDFIEASVPFESIDAHTVTFNLGDLEPYECGFITMTVLASCDAELGQIHCIEATASPNDPCPTPTNWNGANLSMEAECLGDELEVTITNSGTSPMSVPLQYIVIEDGIMMSPVPMVGPTLDVAQAFTFTLPANGSTYHITTNQEAGNPDFTTPTLAIEGCGVNSMGEFSTGIVNLLPLGDASTDWYDLMCRDNTGSFDPNDKRGLPLGVGAPNFIEEGTRISYDIQFQNTGTDTAFTVVIRDTLAPEFDWSSLRMGASSHHYVYELDSTGELTITFNDIMLPDSNVNLALSQGVVSYTIDHKAGIPLGTELLNQAAIYFDFNEPIYTSTTLHTLGEDFLSTLVPTGARADLRMRVFPNPTNSGSFANVSLPIPLPYELEVYDGLGRKVSTYQNCLATQRIDLTNFKAGWYVIRALSPAGEFLSVERLLVE